MISIPAKQKLFNITAFVLLLYFIFLGLTKAQSFFGPVVVSIILSLIILPLVRFFERKLNRSIASLLGVLVLLLVSAGFVTLIIIQGKNVVDDWPMIKKEMIPKLERFESTIIDYTPISKQDINEFKDSPMPAGNSGSSKKAAKEVSSLFTSVSGFFANFLLVMVYIYFILRYRARLRNFLLKVFDDQKKEVSKTITKSTAVAPQYLIGKLILIGLLAIVYSIGLGISGVSNFILVSVIAAVLTLIPFVGNIIGFGMAIVFGYLSTGEVSTLIGIVLTFSISQFLESYVLQPYIVGDKVEVHPFVVIIAVIIGSMVWGIIGMVIAIPVIGIVTVILIHLKSTHALGILLSDKKFD
ncbi:AI-2E family transporter [Gangjinia marincola]|uniref:AI-2E family transporter n=1 Tax=Gangjinia marincola TaxID=578463 RepID=A0ABP3XTW6_9FLAO